LTIPAPPTQQPIITDQSGFPSLPWIVFFNALFQGDAGQFWIPTFANLTESGGVPYISGRVYQLSKYLAVFVINITPATGGSTSSTAGTTYVNNFPLTAQGNGVCLAVSGNLGAGAAGMLDQSSGYIYVPPWSAVTVPLTIIGLVEAS
jgi:hypothetical protein